jgi:hypothetical protein
MRLGMDVTARVAWYRFGWVSVGLVWSTWIGVQELGACVSQGTVQSYSLVASGKTRGSSGVCHATQGFIVCMLLFGGGVRCRAGTTAPLDN